MPWAWEGPLSAERILCQPDDAYEGSLKNLKNPFSPDRVHRWPKSLRGPYVPAKPGLCPSERALCCSIGPDVGQNGLYVGLRKSHVWRAFCGLRQPTIDRRGSGLSGLSSEGIHYRPEKRLSIWDELLSTKEGILTVWMGTCWPEIPLQYDYSILNNSETVARNAAVLFLSSSTCTDSWHPLSKFKGERSEFVTYIDFCDVTIRRFRSKTAKRLDVRQKLRSRSDCK